VGCFLALTFKTKKLLDLNIQNLQFSSDSGFCLAKKYEAPIISMVRITENTKNISNIEYSVLTKELFNNNIILISLFI